MPTKKKAKQTKLAVKPDKPTDAEAKADAPAPAPVAMKQKEQVSIAKAKGRPMLSWVGKRPLRAVTAFPAQHVESFTASGADKAPVADAAIWKGWPATYPHGGLLFHGDNKEVLAHLLANGFRGRAQLIYIDPPFDSGVDYVRKVNLRGPVGKVALDGESYTLGEQVQYTDIWAKDNYLQFMYERLLLLRELLADNGSIVLHCDSTRSHFLRFLMEEIFGGDAFFKNEIIWFYRRWPTNTPSFQSMHDNLFWFSKCNDNKHTFNKLYERASERTLSDYGGKKLTTVQTEDGSFVKRETDEVSEGVAMRDVWEISREHPRGHEHTDYPTQKPTALLDRLVTALSNPGDLVLDAFVGSRTTAVVAQRLGRRWVACDINKGAIQTTTKRLQTDIAQQLASASAAVQQPELLADDQPKAAPPAQLFFSVHRVNNYDLAIQHNEAVNLVCEHIGVTRMLADAFFNGTLGKKLVKIIPFGHPLSPTDLEEVKRELDARANESRDVVVVCLGKELGVDVWLADWNRMRKQGDTPNKIEVIELRSDPKYGKFFAHKPAKARVDIHRLKKDKEGDTIVVVVTDFISPSIIERLQGQSNLLSPKISDWRAMVDSVMIDYAYDGKVFNIALADVPTRKQDLVKGTYELPAPASKTTVAVKVTDMLGEEVLVTANV
jgi:DNA modification methylase